MVSGDLYRSSMWNMSFSLYDGPGWQPVCTGRSRTGVLPREVTDA
jgi:hypothetical protein